MTGIEKYVRGNSKMTRNLLKSNPKLANLSLEDIKGLEEKMVE